MRVPWKVIGVAGLAGVAASGVVVARKRRAHSDMAPDELRDRLHQRLAQAGSATPAASAPPSRPLSSQPDGSDRPR